MKTVYYIFLLFLFQLCSNAASAMHLEDEDAYFVVVNFYADTTKPADTSNPVNKISDSSYQKSLQRFNPHKATIRSAIFPGWGQFYNKKYWKVPLVWGGIGATVGIFFYNVKTYKALKQAYIYKTDGDQTNDLSIDPRFSNLSANALKTYRNSFRQNVDYSVLFFILFWGLNVVDATVDAHLKAFDVNDDLSLHFKAGYSELANTTGVSLVLKLGK